MAESLISSLYQAVSDKLQEEGRLLLGVPSEAKKMKKNLESIRNVLASAEKKEAMDANVRRWVCELKDVAYDIEDVLDDWSMAQLQIQDKFGTLPRVNESKEDGVCFSCIPTPCFFFKQVKGRHDIAHTIVEINERLDEIAKRRNNFDFEKNSVNRRETIERKPTTPFGFFHDVPSQKIAKDELIQVLVPDDFGNPRRPSDQRIPIVSLVGIGGIGKTTLAKLVYGDKIVQDNFSKIIWIYVSDTFVEMNVARAIAGALGLNVAYLTDLPNVLSEIANSIKGLKFLLILDDVWEESEGRWNDILSCLGKGDTKGSRILLTTRSKRFAEKMRSVFTLSLDVLSDDDALSLFSYYAFPGISGESDHAAEVKDIAEELVKKCNGLPLALEVLGRHMDTKATRGKWAEVLTSKIWETRFEEQIFHSLVFSYLELSSEAKRCFVFCSVFPKGAIMKKNKLIRLWMAQGYLQGKTADEMEIFGEECFESLERRSFFRLAKLDTDEDDTVVKMHDIVRDFALYISNGEAATLDPSLAMQEGDARTKLRHLAYNGDISESTCPLYLRFDLKALRTLFVTTHSIAIELWSNKSYIRALDIIFSSDSITFHDYSLKGIGKLAHLRYVRLVSSNLTVLPEEICDLHYLQTLEVSCPLEKLPSEIGKLTRLRHLLFSSEGELASLPKGLGKLRSLRTLSCFHLSSFDSKDCCSLEDLRDLNNLQGDLWLKNLNQVADVSEATRAKLHKKIQILRLILEFGDGAASIQSQVLRALQPAQKNIEFLEIISHRGSSFPSWIGQLQNLKEVRLKNVSIVIFPALGKLPSLEKLSVKYANEVEHVGEEFYGSVRHGTVCFPKLTDLDFEDMTRWKHWEGPTAIIRSRVTIMPSLYRLRVKNCESLRTLPCFLEKAPLESLEVDVCNLPHLEIVEDADGKKPCIGDAVLPWSLKNIVIRTADGVATTHLREKEAAADQRRTTNMLEGQQQQPLNFNDVMICGHPNFLRRIPRWIMDLTAVKEIKLKDISDEQLPPFGLLPCLEELSIDNASEVRSVGHEFFHGSTNDASMHLKLERLFPRLEKLCFSNMEKWEEWADPRFEVTRRGIKTADVMKSLRCLELTYCGNLKKLPSILYFVPLKMLTVKVVPKSGDMPRIALQEDWLSEREKWAWKRQRARREWKLEREWELERERERERGKREWELERKREWEREIERNLAESLQEITLGNIQNAWLTDWGIFCVSLKKLELFHCDELSLLGLGVLPSLEILFVSSETIKHVGRPMLWADEIYLSLREDAGRPRLPRRPLQLSDIGENPRHNYNISFPRLKVLYFDEMPNWEVWDDLHSLESSDEPEGGSRRGGNNPAIAKIMPRLRILSLWSCPRLRALPSFFKDIHLEQLIIHGCDALDTWWQNEAGQDWHDWKSTVSQ